jgi:DNA-binding FrmR family transcriptional regulator
MARHETHPQILARLRRAEGHLKAVIGMMEAARPCVVLAQQLHAVEAGVASAKRELIHDHIENCLNSPSSQDTGQMLAELKAITKYL